MSNKVDVVNVKQSGCGCCKCRTKWMLQMSNKVDVVNVKQSGIVDVKQSGCCRCQTKWML